MVIDVICYNGEQDLFDLRYNILKDYVDEFIVVEFDKTFSGKEKEFKFRKDFDLSKIDRKAHAKEIKVCEWQEGLYSKYKDLALSSPNTQYGQGAEHWVREFCQKESIKDCLTHLQDDDIVFIGDCDEIWDPLSIPECPSKLFLRVYTYYLNNRSNETFWGTLLTPYKLIKESCLNHLRITTKKSFNFEEVLPEYAGWHFTSLKDGLKQKLEDSYTEETYANQQVMDSLEENIEDNKDFLGRNFSYRCEEDYWPVYLTENREKYKHLCK